MLSRVDPKNGGVSSSSTNGGISLPSNGRMSFSPTNGGTSLPLPLTPLPPPPAQIGEYLLPPQIGEYYLLPANWRVSFAATSGRVLFTPRKLTNIFCRHKWESTFCPPRMGEYRLPAQMEEHLCPPCTKLCKCYRILIVLTLVAKCGSRALRLSFGRFTVMVALICVTGGAPNILDCYLCFSYINDRWVGNSAFECCSSASSSLCLKHSKGLLPWHGVICHD